MTFIPKATLAKFVLIGGFFVCSVSAARSEPPSFAQALPDDIKWSPTTVAPGVQAATLLGNPGR
ncbi:MAG: hypothetical protein JNK75_02605 [Betaproteobacteria bacterium]|nr:hypothetical protein [Betaproteobacteria bacterium]